MIPRAVIAVSVLALAGCEPQTPSYRQGMEPMLLAAVPAATLAGEWYQIALFPNPVEAGCRQTKISVAPRGEGGFSVIQTCRRGGVWTQISGKAQARGAGQYRLEMAGAPAQDLRVLGTGKDGRSLLLGTRDRMSGWLLHRDARMSEADRRAARDIFGKNGYDRAAMQLVSQP